MTLIPENLKYSKTHEWVRVENDVAVIGITDHAQSELGDVVYLSLPEVGRILKYDEPFGEVESVKAVSELYSPLSGEVIEVNTTIIECTEVVNEDPYGRGWLIKVSMSDPSELDKLMDADAYAKHCEES